MTSKKIKNENLHECNEERKRFDNCVKSILDMKFDDEDAIDKILEFYLFHALTGNSDDEDSNKKPSKNDKKFGFKALKDYGWEGRPKLLELENLLLKEAEIKPFCFCLMKADGLQNMLKAMNLDAKICFKHPRAVMMQNYSVIIQEDCKLKINEKETRLQCLFRHIRNSFAHNRTYLLDEDLILLEDANGKKITARILMPKEALLSWIDIIKKGPSN